MNELMSRRAQKLKDVSKDMEKEQTDTIIALVMDVAFDYMSSPMDALNFIREIKQIKKIAAEQE
jgi:hypothetical protein